MLPQHMVKGVAVFHQRDILVRQGLRDSRFTVLQHRKSKLTPSPREAPAQEEQVSGWGLSDLGDKCVINEIVLRSTFSNAIIAVLLIDPVSKQSKDVQRKSIGEASCTRHQPTVHHRVSDLLARIA